MKRKGKRDLRKASSRMGTEDLTRNEQKVKKKEKRERNCEREATRFYCASHENRSGLLGLIRRPS